jgi:hypothetical protein
MTESAADTVIRQAIGGDDHAIALIAAQADTTETVALIVMAALLEPQPDRLDRAASVASTSRDRQMVAIARSHLGGHSELVNALARDHLVDYPDSLIIAWIASGAVPPSAGNMRR